MNVCLFKNEENVQQTAEEIMQKQYQAYSTLLFQLKMKAYVYDLLNCEVEKFVEWLDTCEGQFEEMHENEILTIEKAFQTYDTDKSGSMDKEEMQRCLLAMGYEAEIAKDTVKTWWPIIDR